MPDQKETATAGTSDGEQFTVQIGLNAEGKALLNQATELAKQATDIIKEIESNPDKYVEVRPDA
jgi:hypothetical protein